MPIESELELPILHSCLATPQALPEAPQASPYPLADLLSSGVASMHATVILRLLVCDTTPREISGTLGSELTAGGLHLVTFNTLGHHSPVGVLRTILERPLDGKGRLALALIVFWMIFL